jgi:hypothetical protein
MHNAGLGRGIPAFSGMWGESGKLMIVRDIQRFAADV